MIEVDGKFFWIQSKYSFSARQRQAENDLSTEEIISRMIVSSSYDVNGWKQTDEVCFKDDCVSLLSVNISDRQIISS